MPPPNLPLWDADYFELRTLEKEQMQEEAFAALLSLCRDRSSERKVVVMNPLP